jgi:hypothetical protein
MLCCCVSLEQPIPLDCPRTVPQLRQRLCAEARPQNPHANSIYGTQNFAMPHISDPTSHSNFNHLQNSAHLVEDIHFQILSAQNDAHSFALFSRKSFVCRSYAKHTRGCTPQSAGHQKHHLKFRVLCVPRAFSQPAPICGASAICSKLGASRLTDRRACASIARHSSPIARHAALATSHSSLATGGS